MPTDLTKSDAYRIGYSISMFENIIGHLGAAADSARHQTTKVIADHIDAALTSAQEGLRLLTAGKQTQ